MKTLVTGASGFVGRALLDHLLQHSDASSIISIGLKPPAHKPVHHLSCDLSDPDAVIDALRSLDVQTIYHLAGSARISDEVPFSDYFSKNFLTTLALVEGLRELGKASQFFFASSVHVYGNQSGKVDETAQIHPMNAYGFTKYLAEEALRRGVAQNEKLQVVIGRLYSCIGPGQPPGFVAADLCQKVAAADTHLKVGPLEAARQFLDVRDAVKLFPALLSAKRASRFEIFNLASPELVEVQEMLRHLLSIAGKQPKIESAPSDNRFRGIQVSTQKLTKSVKTTFRPLRETLQDMYSEVSVSFQA